MGAPHHGTSDISCLYCAQHPAGMQALVCAAHTLCRLRKPESLKGSGGARRRQQSCGACASCRTMRTDQCWRATTARTGFTMTASACGHPAMRRMTKMLRRLTSAAPPVASRCLFWFPWSCCTMIVFKLVDPSAMLCAKQSRLDLHSAQQRNRGNALVLYRSAQIGPSLSVCVGIQAETIGYRGQL